MLKHPAERSAANDRGRFERLAERASFLASSPPFFVLCFVVVALWIVGVAVGAGDRFLTAVGGGMSAMTLILVALVKNAEMRSELAIQQKLDAIARSLLEDKRGERDGDAADKLEGAIGLHEQI